MGTRSVETGNIYYSERFKGNARNYNLSVGVDWQDGFVRLTQQDRWGKTVDIVLLSPLQWKCVRKFVDEFPAR